MLRECRPLLHGQKQFKQFIKLNSCRVYSLISITRGISGSAIHHVIRQVLRKQSLPGEPWQAERSVSLLAPPQSGTIAQLTDGGLVTWHPVARARVWAIRHGPRTCRNATGISHYQDIIFVFLNLTLDGSTRFPEKYYWVRFCFVFLVLEGWLRGSFLYFFLYREIIFLLVCSSVRLFNDHLTIRN